MYFQHLKWRNPIETRLPVFNIDWDTSSLPIDPYSSKESKGVAEKILLVHFQRLLSGSFITASSIFLRKTLGTPDRRRHYKVKVRNSKGTNINLNDLELAVKKLPSNEPHLTTPLGQ